MLSYRHAFHAGNHADVLKHLTEVLILQYLTQKKDKALRYIDTHSGPGIYSLVEGYSQQKQEYADGIAKLWQQPDLPECVRDYCAVVAEVNRDGACRHYPGSPAIARLLLRDIDKCNLFELHPQDYSLLSRWRGKDRRIQVEQRDGFEGLISVLPPLEKRGLVMIDPPYEIKADYHNVVKVLREACRRFATGVYAIWYPLLQRSEVELMLKQLKANSSRYLKVELQVCAPSSWGMYGSGMFVINPPWRLAEQMQQALPYLQRHLGQDDAASYRIESRGLD